MRTFISAHGYNVRWHKRISKIKRN